MELQVIINRFKITRNYSLGHCYIKYPNNRTVYVGCSLERGWRNNENNVSCVPEGTYELKLDYSPKFRKKLWELFGVPGRSECKFHAANYWRQLNGCIALGNKHTYIDNDEDLDITSSIVTMAKFHKLMEEATKAKVIINNI